MHGLYGVAQPVTHFPSRGIAAFLLLVSSGVHAADAPFPVESNLLAAVAKIDITPPEGTPVVGHVREVSGVRDPLHAALLLLELWRRGRQRG